MSKEYIPKDEVEQALIKEAAHLLHHYKRYLSVSDVVNELIEVVQRFPAADVVPVRRGRWEFGKDLPDSFGSINKNKYHLYCSECRNQAFNKNVDNDPDFDVDTPFCPWCGAKMNKEDRP